MAKGASFERKIAKELSLWWTSGQSDAVFWRSSQSGGRATTREKSGRKTKGQYGDIAVTDPIGQPFMDIVNIELKVGYNHLSPMLFLEAAERPKNSIADFFDQSARDATRAGVPIWWVIHKRDRKEPVLYAPMNFFWVFPPSSFPVFASFDIHKCGEIGAVQWNHFKATIQPSALMEAW